MSIALTKLLFAIPTDQPWRITSDGAIRRGEPSTTSYQCPLTAIANQPIARIPYTHLNQRFGLNSDEVADIANAIDHPTYQPRYFPGNLRTLLLEACKLPPQ